MHFFIGSFITAAVLFTAYVIVIHFWVETPKKVRKNVKVSAAVISGSLILWCGIVVYLDYTNMIDISMPWDKPENKKEVQYTPPPVLEVPRKTVEDKPQIVESERKSLKEFVK